jgi:hypothetical protein
MTDLDHVLIGFMLKYRETNPPSVERSRRIINAIPHLSTEGKSFFIRSVEMIDEILTQTN